MPGVEGHGAQLAGAQREQAEHGGQRPRGRVEHAVLGTGRVAHDKVVRQRVAVVVPARRGSPCQSPAARQRPKGRPRTAFPARDVLKVSRRHNGAGAKLEVAGRVDHNGAGARRLGRAIPQQGRKESVLACRRGAVRVRAGVASGRTRFTRKEISAWPLPAGLCVVTLRRNVYTWPAVSAFGSKIRLSDAGPERDTVGSLRFRACATPAGVGAKARVPCAGSIRGGTRQRARRACAADAPGRRPPTGS